MKFYVLAALVSAASAGVIYPAGVDPVACPNYPYCSVDVPAALPTPVVRGPTDLVAAHDVPRGTIRVAVLIRKLASGGNLKRYQFSRSGSEIRTCGK